MLRCYGVLLPFRKSPVTTAGASRAARKTERWESLTGGYLGFHGLKAGVHAPLQASGPRHASRATPSRGLASRRLVVVALASRRAGQAGAGSAAREAPRAVVFGLPGGRNLHPYAR